jgi:hypothetical protein
MPWLWNYWLSRHYYLQIFYHNYSRGSDSTWKQFLVDKGTSAHRFKAKPLIKCLVLWRALQHTASQMLSHRKVKYPLQESRCSTMTLPGGICTQNLNVYMRNLLGFSSVERIYPIGVKTYLHLFRFTHCLTEAGPIPFPELSFILILNSGKLHRWRGSGMFSINNA